MTYLRVSEAALFLGVSDDTVRRWIESGELAASDDGGRKRVDGAAVARLAKERAAALADIAGVQSSARNRFVGIVTDVKADAVMAQVELQCGPFRVVSLMSSEAVAEMGLAPGSVATAVIKSTNVIVEKGSS